jgi:diguanylate cyclase (GGDEF)-like protein
MTDSWPFSGQFGVRGSTLTVVPHDASTEARLQAYRLMEALQGGRGTSAAAELDELRRQADAAGWPDVALLADLGVVMRGVIHPAPDGAPDTRHELDRLVADAERLGAPALLAHVLGLRAITAAASADTEGVLTDASRGLALLDRDDLPPLDACTALVVCAGALNALALWELVGEIYDRASALSPHCEEPLQAAAIAMNRILIPIEWATELLELEEDEPAREQLGLALRAAESAHRLDRLPDDWRLAVAACRSALEFCLDPLAAESSLAEMKLQQQVLRSAGDVEMLPLSEVLVALRLLQTGRPAEALAWIGEDTTESASSGAHSFRLWVRARAVAASGQRADPAVPAAFAYAGLLATQRRQARRALLGAARSRIAGERLRVERDRLFRDVAQDALTGLGNRRTFDTWLERDRTTITPTAMLLIDLDSFKAINDEHGHSVGDEVLRQVGSAIAHHVRQRDLALRLGGDEFAVIIEAWAEDSTTGVDSLAASAHERAHRIQGAIATVPWADIATGLTVSASVGVAVRALEAHDDGGPTVLYNDADRELYVAKRRRNLPPPA